VSNLRALSPSKSIRSYLDELVEALIRRESQMQLKSRTKKIYPTPPALVIKLGDILLFFVLLALLIAAFEFDL
jgi:hypothetical protein